MKDIKIFVSFYKECKLYPEIEDKLNTYKYYIPIHCGRDEYIGSSQFLLKMIGDNTGNNISYLNSKLFDPTVLWWIATNYKNIGDPEFIGYHHYKRFLNFNIDELTLKKIFVNKFDFHKLNVFSQIQYAECDAETFLSYINVYLLFEKNDKELMMRFLQEHFLYSGCLFIMHKDIFFKLFDFIKLNIDICKLFLNNWKFDNHNFISKSKHPNHSIGMVLERMVGFFLYKLEKTGYEIIPSKIIGEQNPL